MAILKVYNSRNRLLILALYHYKLPDKEMLTLVLDHSRASTRGSYLTKSIRFTPGLGPASASAAAQLPAPGSNCRRAAPDS
jgi:hypothetical protein